ncbi:hypothetical protein, partial [uncultured Acinetobacter sp.]|uniref:hypothetical protein n=1 Tax=uncultured Acinetobacter sp. TaxID=165433 RepID=UPI002590924B
VNVAAGIFCCSDAIFKLPALTIDINKLKSSNISFLEFITTNNHHSIKNEIEAQSNELSK